MHTESGVICWGALHKSCKMLGTGKGPNSQPISKAKTPGATAILSWGAALNEGGGSKKKPSIFPEMTWGRWNRRLGDTSRRTRQGKQNQLQEKGCEKWISGYTKKTALASYTIPPSGTEGFCPTPAAPIGKSQPYSPLIPLLLAMTQQRDNSPGPQQGRGYLLIPLSLKNRSTPYKQPKGKTLSHLSSIRLVLKPAPSLPIKEP